METVIISTEKVKPSSPTPHHLKIYKTSLLDQIVPPIFFPVVLYFLPHPNPNASQIIQILKQSLSINLTRYYLFAGIFKDHLHVDCNDEGVPFLVAKVKGNLKDFLNQPDLLLISNFLPSKFTFDILEPGANVCAIQVNCFECGGLAIGILLAHNVADGITLSTFLRSWAAIARASDEEIYPDFIAQSLFPQKDTIQSEAKLFFDLLNFSYFSKFVTKRFVFDASVISKLKEKSISSDAEYPTRVEVVSAFIWKCFIETFKENSVSQRPFLVTHPVNLRRKADPPLAKESFGNLLWLTAAQCINPIETDFKDLVYKVKRGIKKIDNRFVKVLQDDGYFVNLEETRKEILKEANCLAISSWCKFGLYDIDFGWGKPIWASNLVPSNSEALFLNNVTLMDTRFGDGIEAWVILDEKLMESLEKNEELRSYTSINPSPLQLGMPI